MTGMDIERIRQLEADALPDDLRQAISAELRNALPELLDELETLRAKVAAVEKLIAEARIPGIVHGHEVALPLVYLADLREALDGATS